MPDFLDEMPGSYLAELGTTGWSIVAGALILISTVAVGCGALWAHVDATSTWFVTLRLAWIALGTSALILLVLTLWQLGTAYTEKRPLWILLSLSLAAASLATWGWFSYHAGVLPAPARRLLTRPPRRNERSVQALTSAGSWGFRVGRRDL
jgi:hypothetical protein